jgi:hypothetical protein
MRFFNVPTFYGADLFHPFLKLEVSKKIALLCNGNASEFGLDYGSSNLPEVTNI